MENGKWKMVAGKCTIIKKNKRKWQIMSALSSTLRAKIKKYNFLIIDAEEEEEK